VKSYREVSSPRNPDQVKNPDTEIEIHGITKIAASP